MHAMSPQTAAGALLVLAIFVSCTRVASAYVVGGYGFKPPGAFASLYTPTFSAVQQAVPGFSFSLVVLDDSSIWTALDAGAIDFLLLEPSMFICVESEFGVSALASRVSLLNGEPSYYVATAAVTALPTQVLGNLTDIGGRTIAASSYNTMAEWVAPQYDLLAGGSGVQAFAQARSVIFVGTGATAAAYGDLLSRAVLGAVDVAYLPAGYLEAAVVSGAVAPGVLRVVQPRALEGRPDVAVSTASYPEWVFCAAPSVPTAVKQQVATAMLALATGSTASASAGISGWVLPQSVLPVQNALSLLGTLSASGRCTRLTAPYPTSTLAVVSCARNTYATAPASRAAACPVANVTCAPGDACICGACALTPAAPVVVFNSSFAVGGACKKLEVCATVTQNQALTFTAVNLLWSQQSAGCTTNSSWLSFLYRGQADLSLGTWVALPNTCSGAATTFTFTAPTVGYHLVEVNWQGAPTAASPFLVAVVAVHCGDNALPQTDGTCICNSNAYQLAVGGACYLLNTTALGVGLGLAVVLAVVTAWAVIHWIHLAGEAQWQIMFRDITFSDPLVHLGRGTYGMVVKGFYRGSPVAVKRMLPRMAAKRVRIESASVGTASLFDFTESTSSVTTSAAGMGESGEGETAAESNEIQRNIAKALSLLKLNPTSPLLRMASDVRLYSRSSIRRGRPLATTKLMTSGENSASNGQVPPPPDEELGPITSRRRSITGHVAAAIAAADAGSGSAMHPQRSFRRSFSLPSTAALPSQREWTAAEAAGSQTSAAAAVEVEPVTASTTEPISQRGAGVGVRFTSPMASHADVPLIPQRRALAHSQSIASLFSTVSAVASSVLGFGAGGSSLTVVEGGAREEARRQFMKEMRTVVHLRHPHIVTVLGACVERSHEPLLILEYLERGSLYDLLRNETLVLDGDILVPLVKDIVSGLCYLHLADPPVLHNDLKSANVLIDSSFRAKVADFGLSNKRASGGMIGTPFWMAPELLVGGVPSTASDVYAFGILMYEVVSRCEPYEEENPIEVLLAVANIFLPVPKRPEIPASCPDLFRELMTACWAPLPQHRPTFQAIANRLNGVDSIAVTDALRSRVEDGNRDSLIVRDVFPPRVAKALKEGLTVQPESYESVTIYFSDVIGFQDYSARLPASTVVDMLDRLYKALDGLTVQHGLFKVETIGDAYMACGGLPEPQPDHTARVAAFALDAVKAAARVPVSPNDPSLGFVSIRVGFHSGPCVASVVGNMNPRFCLFGDTVNTASRMESNSSAGRIHLSKASADLLRVQNPAMQLSSRGRISVKGKGEMETYWLVGLEAHTHHPLTRQPNFPDVHGIRNSLHDGLNQGVTAALPPGVEPSASPALLHAPSIALISSSSLEMDLEIAAERFMPGGLVPLNARDIQSSGLFRRPSDVGPVPVLGSNGANGLALASQPTLTDIAETDGSTSSLKMSSSASVPEVALIMPPGDPALIPGDTFEL